MASDFAIIVEGMSRKDAEVFKPEKYVMAQVRSLNRTTDRTRTASVKQMRQEVNFSAAYLNPSSGRFTVSRRATGTSLEAAIKGRDRPTSLARFVTSTARPNKAGVTVEVAPGISKYLPKAFLIKLPAGRAGDVQTRSNLGLAIRLPEGQTLRNKREAIRLKNGLYLLYGPSVDQVFRSVREAQAEPAAEFLEAEFLRQLDL